MKLNSGLTHAFLLSPSKYLKYNNIQYNIHAYHERTHTCMYNNTTYVTYPHYPIYSSQMQSRYRMIIFAHKKIEIGQCIIIY